MRYRSTRVGQSDVCLSDAISTGLASDGGLFVPESWPSVSENLGSLTALSAGAFADFAAQVLKPFCLDDDLYSSLDSICRDAFNFPVPLVPLDADTSILELFHGPTAAFKDFGARFLARALAEIDDPRALQRLVLVATSGDTGGAVAAAFCEMSEIKVVILFPKGQISLRQEKQLTSWGPQVRAFEVIGSFDDCQAMVKEALRSPIWQSQFHLLSANSINLGRLLPQMCYFGYASLRTYQQNQLPSTFIVPSGNLGNSVAAVWAQKLGFPIARVILAHNANRTVPDFMKTGKWQPTPSLATLANAMDVGQPSNFERLQDLYPDLPELRKHVSAYSVSDEEIRQTIQAFDRQWGQTICPHTATAAFVRTQEKSAGHTIVVATAHPAKFESIVEPLVQHKVEVPEPLARLLRKATRKEEVKPSLQELQRRLGLRPVAG